MYKRLKYERDMLNQEYIESGKILFCNTTEGDSVFRIGNTYMDCVNDIQSLINGLSAKEKDDLYRSLWAEHVREDVESFCESEDIDLSENGIDCVVEQYVYEGKYDCNRSYWDNLRELVEEAAKTDKV